MKRIFIPILTAVATFLAVSSASAEETRHIKIAKPSLLVMVTSDDAQVQLMSMLLTMQSAKPGSVTNVFLCG